MDDRLSGNDECVPTLAVEGFLTIDLIVLVGLVYQSWLRAQSDLFSYGLYLPQSARK
tara:strand:+ start:296 stop:466 length:171 start_codon:yes stop_codon:yes gene_type:complete